MIRAAVLVLAGAALAFAQQSRIGADFEHEGERFSKSCLHPTGFGSIAGCGQVLFTDHPLHISAGSLAPGNGMGLGPAFVAHWTPNERWRLSWDSDAVFSANGSWRAGAYLTAARTPGGGITVVSGDQASTAGGDGPAYPEVSTFHAYVQNTSLNRVAYFGLGQDTALSAKSFFGQSEAIVGGNVFWPLLSRANLYLFGEANGRFVSIRSRTGETSPSIEQVYNEATAPGLTSQPGTAQFGEGLRLRPSFVHGHVRLNYSVTYQQFVASDSRFSFQRLVTDLGHNFGLYRNSRLNLPADHNGPNDCSSTPSPSDPSANNCPSLSRNLEGSIGIRFMMTQSFVPGGHFVPFYFAPTIGGSDINGAPVLSSYEDYRFRGPNAMVLRGSFEHSLFKLPVGVVAMIDEGKVALHPGDLDFSHLAHSYAAGLTLRAGGFPLVYLMFAWGGQHTHHNILRLDTSLLGGSSRPSLY